MLFVRDLGELLAVRRKLVVCAATYGFRLTTLFAQSVGQPDIAFDIFTSLLESDGSPLIVPTLHHLAHLGNPLAVRDHLNHSGHPVLVATEGAEPTC
ncbi:hypothetical protein GCM10009745_44320 [Kribbella yunnanensis]|uniref:Uncharacterized protein n=2 Tax=Kribbella yunnanensis TaxID=190194 RepID=A0ABN2HUP3_9ACTN